MKISKYNASGNDFAIFHTFTHKNRGDLAKQICDRFSGVGADGLIVLVPINGDQNSKKECDFAWSFTIVMEAWRLCVAMARARRHFMRMKTN